ncbi:MAG: carbohydrate-binding protein [Shinella sp.]|nr:carbohydrate-binding protein [Shinella sp.]
MGNRQHQNLRKERPGEALFRQPTHAFLPSAYWFWHSIPDETTCRVQLADFREQGFGTILIQARLSLPLADYMSPAFVAAYRVAIGIAAELGLKAGIYDDYNWISGHAGGRTVAGREHLRERHLFWSAASQREGEISGICPPFADKMGPEILGWQYERGRVEWCEWTIEAAIVHEPDVTGSFEQLVDATAKTRIASSDATGCRFSYDGELASGQLLTVFISARSATSRLINYLLPEAAERFIEVGLDPLMEPLREMVPDTLGFVFYDQPAPGFYRWKQICGNLGNSLLFSHALPAAVEEETKLSFQAALMTLVHDFGASALPTRAQFFSVYSRMMNEAFFGTLRDWAERTGIILTGHEILPHVGAWALNGGFTGIDPRIAPAVDFFGIDAYRHETAVDSNNFSAQLAPKLGDSVARSNGRSRCTVETYASALRTPVRAAGQWELTLETMRTQVIRLHCLGMRQHLWHGLYQTDGRDNDPTPFTNPRFDFGPGINFEPWWSYHGLFAAESARLSAFMEPAKPHAPVAILYPLHTAWAEGPRHDHADHVGAWCAHLLALRCDFMLVSESDLAEGDICNGRIKASGLAFDAIVLPSVTVLQSGAVLQNLAHFHQRCGRVWSSGNRPHVVCDGSSDHGTRLSTTHLVDLPSMDEVAKLLAGLPEIGPTISSLSGPKPWQWVGAEPEGGWRVVLFNDGEEPSHSRISLAGAMSCEAWSPADGRIEDLPDCTTLSVSLEAQELRCLRILPTSGHSDGGLVLSSVPALDERDAKILDSEWHFAADETTSPASLSVEAGWETQGFAAFSGTGIYRRDIVIETEGDWVLDMPQVHTAAAVRIDGRSCGRRAWRPYRFALGHLGAGEHRLEIAVSNTAANRYYDNTPYRSGTPDRSGLTAPPRLVLLKSGKLSDHAATCNHPD